MEVDVGLSEGCPIITQISNASEDIIEIPQEQGKTFGNEAMMNDLILDEIVSCFQSKNDGSSGLKKFRLINRKCYEMGSAVLFGKKGTRSHLWGQLQLDGPLTTDQEAHLLDHGCNAKIVRLNPAYLVGRHAERKIFMRQVVLNHLPEMEVLIVACSTKDQIDDRKASWDSTFLEPDDVLLNLKVVSFAEDKRKKMSKYLGFPFQTLPEMERRMKFFKEILNSAINLVGVYNVDTRFLSTIANCGKSTKMKTIQSGFASICSAMQPRLFVDGMPKLSELTLDHGLSETQVMRLVSSSQATLNRLDLQYRPAGYGPYRFAWIRMEMGQLPSFKNVQTANFGTIVQLLSFRGAEALQHIFPNLRKVVLETSTENLIPLAQGVPLPGVTVLEIRAQIKEAGFAWLEGWFPCLQKVKVDWKIFKKWAITHDLPEDRLWLLPITVQYLELENFDLIFYEDYGLDAFLTGIPKKVCRDVQKLKHPIDCDKFRECGGIAALKNLKILKLNMKQVTWEQLKELKALSYLSRKYALDLLDVKVHLAFTESSYQSGRLNQVLHLIGPIADITTVSFY